MRRVVLLLLSFLLAASTVGGSIAHATEVCAGSSLVADTFDLANPFEIIAKKDNKNSSKDKRVAVFCHCCHGHHSAVPVDFAPMATEILPGESYLHVFVTELLPASFAWTFRPPIA